MNKMLASYYDLVRSEKIDKLIWSKTRKYLFPIILTLAYQNWSFKPLIFLLAWYIRTSIVSLYGRLFLTGLLTICYLEYPVLVIFVVITEILRFGAIFLPRLFSRSEALRLYCDPIIQGAFRVLYYISRNGVRDIEKIKDLFSRPFTDEEQETFLTAVSSLDHMLIWSDSLVSMFFLTGAVFFVKNEKLTIIAEKLTIVTSTETCPICYSSEDDKWVQLNCGTESKHGFCLKCFAGWFSDHPECPLCRNLTG